MASLKNRRGSWYGRVLWYEKEKKKEKEIPLRIPCKKKKEECRRVNKVEDDIKREWIFPFLGYQTQQRPK